MAHVIKSTTNINDKNRWATTKECFLDAQKLYGKSFKLDVCAEINTAKVDSFIAPPNIFELDSVPIETLTCGVINIDQPKIFAVDALKNNWINDWWCNPPFDQKISFICKAIEQDALGYHGMMLLPYEPLTQWWQTYVNGNAAIIYEPNGRYNFLESDGITKKNSVNFGSAFVLFDSTKKTTPRILFNRGIGKSDD